MLVRNNTNRVPYFKDCPKPLTFSPRNIIIIKRTKFACLAQPVEHAAVNRSVGGSSPSTGARKHLISRCFFLALFEDMTPARFARFRRSRNDTADTALDAIGTPCSDRYSVTSFLTGVRVPQQAPFERNRESGFFLFLKSFSNPLTLFSPCTTFACRSDGENSLFRHFVPYGGSSPSRGPRRKYFRWGCFRRQKTPHLEVFFLALFGDMTPALCALSAQPK